MPKSTYKSRSIPWIVSWVLLLSLCPVLAQNPSPEPAPVPPEGKPLVANLCPKFAIAGTSRRLKFYGAHLAGIELKAEDEDLSFLDYTFDPNGMAFSVTVDTKPTARIGKRTLLLLVGATEPKNPVQEITLYVLKKEDKALLQKDLVRCPWMREEDAGKAPKPSPPVRGNP
jgi:hypothetical protein